MSIISLRAAFAAFLGIVAGRIAFVFFDEILGLERAVRSAARGVAS